MGPNPSKTKEQEETLRKTTKFNDKELKDLFDSFQKEHPRGQLTQQRLHILYANMYPLGNATAFSKCVFNACNTNKKPEIDFMDFIKVLNVLIKGSHTDKIDWIFQLCDQDGDHLASQAELTEVVKALYLMKGDPKASEQAANVTSTLFAGRAADSHRGGLSKAEFRTAALRSDHLAAILRTMQGQS